MNPILPVVETLHQATEKSLVFVEGFHQNLAAKPIQWVEKVRCLRGPGRSLRLTQQHWINKTYRGARDLCEFNRQLSEQMLSAFWPL